MHHVRTMRTHLVGLAHVLLSEVAAGEVEHWAVERDQLGVDQAVHYLCGRTSEQQRFRDEDQLRVLAFCNALHNTAWC